MTEASRKDCMIIVERVNNGWTVKDVYAEGNFVCLEWNEVLKRVSERLIIAFGES